ncbi:MAG: DUF1523 family protein [Pacificimonas sp.]|jgi:hypothetical protein|nr:DUF1523 family protein [Pacificimonas sp.]
MLRFLILIPVLIVFAFLHWTLPSRDVVRIVGTDVVRQDTAQRSQDTPAASRDVRLINTVDAGGDARVYRNEDTDWGWPPYFKFDSADLAAEALNAASTEADPNWVVLTHYGWRVPFLSLFPNATSIRPAEGPEESLFPWFNILLLALLAGLAFAARRQVLRLFRGRRATS